MAYTRGNSYEYGRPSSVRALTVAGATNATGPAEFWQGRMLLVTAQKRAASKGSTFMEPAYFSFDEDPVKKVSFKQAEEDISGW